MTPHFGYVMLVVNNTSVSVDFYKKLLGIDPDFIAPRWSQFTIGDMMLGLHAVDSWSDPQDPLAHTGIGQKGTSFGFYVEDLKGFIDLAASQNLKPTYGPRMTGVGDLVYFIDPDGHYVQVCEPLKK